MRKWRKIDGQRLGLSTSNGRNDKKPGVTVAPIAESQATTGVTVITPPEEYTPAAIRQKALNVLGSRLDRLANIADGVTTLSIVRKCPKCHHVPPKKGNQIDELERFVRPSDQTAAMRVLAQLTSSIEPETVTQEDARRLLEALHSVLAKQLAPEVAGTVWKESLTVYEEWTKHAASSSTARTVQVVYSHE